MHPSRQAALTAALDPIVDQLIALRRDVHAHPELSHQEFRTTEVLGAQLVAAGLSPKVLPRGTGLTCDIGTLPPTIGLRGDLDALPIGDDKDVDYRSTVDGCSHACGHDVHATVVLGAGLVLADLDRQGLLPGSVRLLLQAGEEAIPGGALDVIAAGGVDGLRRMFTVHCDPRADVGTVGLRVGPITGSVDHVRVRLAGPGGHTARPHLTADLVYALAKIITDVPAVLSRRVDPRSGLSLVWGRVVAGGAANAIPRTGEVEGTVRTLDVDAWELAPTVVEEAVRAVASPYGPAVEIDYQRGVPPVVNDAACVDTLTAAAHDISATLFEAEQSAGAEDFAWYLDRVPGALARLGVRRPGDLVSRDLHQGSFDVDERAIAVGVRLLATAALLSMT